MIRIVSILARPFERALHRASRPVPVCAGVSILARPFERALPWASPHRDAVVSTRRLERAPPSTQTLVLLLSYESSARTRPRNRAFSPFILTKLFVNGYSSRSCWFSSALLVRAYNQRLFNRPPCSSIDLYASPLVDQAIPQTVFFFLTMSNNRRITLIPSR